MLRPALVPLLASKQVITDRHSSAPAVVRVLSCQGGAGCRVRVCEGIRTASSQGRPVAAPGGHAAGICMLQIAVLPAMKLPAY